VPQGFFNSICFTPRWPIGGCTRRVRRLTIDAAAGRILLAAFCAARWLEVLGWLTYVGEGAHDVEEVWAAVPIPAVCQQNQLLGMAADPLRAGATGSKQRDGGGGIPRASGCCHLQPDSRLSCPDEVSEEQPKERGHAGAMDCSCGQAKVQYGYDLDSVCDIAESQHRLLIERLSSQPGQLARLHVISLGVAERMQQALDLTLLQLGLEIWKDLAACAATRVAGLRVTFTRSSTRAGHSRDLG
jgi:hypothetical protein